MDGNNFTIRQEHLQKLLKRYELTAPNSLGGPAAMLATATIQQPTSIDPGTKQNTLPSSQTSVSNALATFMLQRENVQNQSTSNIGLLPVLNDILSLKHAIPVQPFPILLQNDRASASIERLETILEGECISCFSVGGEKRLCLPQVLNTVLKTCTMMEINRARTDLNIHCSHCTPEQLHVLKTAGVLSSTANSCSLITKTDAERLCNYLLRQKADSGKNSAGRSTSLGNKSGPDRSAQTASAAMNGHIEPGQSNSVQSSNEKSIEDVNEDVVVPVMHLCFGRCRGRYRPDLYASPSAECIECDECGDYFAPDRFVMHSHRNQERRICHWGFDSANWRAYIHLPADNSQVEENVKILNQMKLRFDVTGLTKRRLDENSAESNSDEHDQQKKRPRLESTDTIGPVVSTAKDKAIPSIPSFPFNVTGLKEQAALLYLLCDPIFLATYCQNFLWTGSNGGRMITSHQSASPVMAPSGGVDGSANAIKGAYLNTLQHQHQQQLQPSVNSTTAGSDEVTAAAALKLLQLRSWNEMGNECGPGANIRSTDTNRTQQTTAGANAAAPTEEYGSSKMDQSCCSTISLGSNLEKSPQNRHTWPTSNKESYKKHLLHLFSVEQQQKRQFLELQQQQQQRQPIQHHQSDPGRAASVEVIVDDDVDGHSDKGDGSECNLKMPLVVTKSLQATPTGDQEGSDDDENGRMSEETRVAEEECIGISDCEDGERQNETSLDDLLKHYINDEDGLRAIKDKIASNQWYLEKKLDAVLSENRLLRAECIHLRTKEIRCDKGDNQKQQRAMV